MALQVEPAGSPLADWQLYKKMIDPVTTKRKEAIVVVAELVIVMMAVRYFYYRQDRVELTTERKANGHAGSSKMSVVSKSSSDSNQGPNTWKSVGAVPRDPKSRARSREYLKQYVLFQKHVLTIGVYRKSHISLRRVLSTPSHPDH